MPDSHPSILETRGPTLLPGEDHVKLRKDSYYGEVEDASPVRIESPRARGNRLQREVNAGVAALDGDEQNRVEVLTGKRLQQREGPGREELPPTDLPVPTVASLSPDTVALGAPDFDVHVIGANFVDGSVIVFAGQDEPTTLNSDTDVSTGVNMALWVGPDAVPVLVRNPDNQESNTVMFTFTGTLPGRSASESAGRGEAASKPAGKPVAPKKDDDKGGR